MNRFCYGIFQLSIVEDFSIFKARFSYGKNKWESQKNFPNLNLPPNRKNEK